MSRNTDLPQSLSGDRLLKKLTLLNVIEILRRARLQTTIITLNCLDKIK